MTNQFSTNPQFADNRRHPLTAAMLSVLPGLGQLYLGEKRKGILFLDVTAANIILLWLMLFTEPMLKAISQMGATFHFRPNELLMEVVKQAHMGSPASLLLVAMMLAFGSYAARDAYDHAFGLKRKKIYAESVLEFSEATSGSYIFHIAMIFAFATLALFFVMPSQKKEIVSISFIDLEKFEKPVHHQRPTVASTKPTAAHGHKTPHADASKQSTPSSTQSDKTSTSQPSKSSSSKSADTKQSESSAGAKTVSKPDQPVKEAAATHPAHNPPAAQLPAPPAPHVVRQTPTLAKVAPNPVQQRIPAFNPQPNPILRQPSAVQPRPQPLGAQADKNPSPARTLPSLESNKLIAMNVPMPSLPVPNPLFASGQPLLAPSSHSSGHTAGSALPVPAATPSGSRGANIGALPSQTRGSSASRAFDVPLPGHGRVHDGTDNNGAAHPSPVAVNVSGPGTAMGAPNVVAVNSAGDRHGLGRGEKPSNGHSPKHVGPSFGNDIMSVTPNVAPVGNTNGPGHGTRDGARNDTDNLPNRDGSEVFDCSQYMANLQRRIKKHWMPPRHTESRTIVVMFTVARDGALSELHITRSSGVSIADQAAIQAVQNSAPLPPLPPHAPESVQIEFTFDYNVFSGATGGNWHRL